MKVCNLCKRQFLTEQGRQRHADAARCLPLEVPPTEQQHTQRRNELTATVPYVSGRPQPIHAVPWVDNGGNVTGGSGIGGASGAGGSGNRQHQQMDGTDTSALNKTTGENSSESAPMHQQPIGVGTSATDAADHVGQQHVKSAHEHWMKGHEMMHREAAQRRLNQMAVRNGNVAGGIGIVYGRDAGGNNNRQQMDGTSSNGRKRRNDNGTNDNGDSIAGIDKAIEEYAEQEAADEADDDGTLDVQIKRAKLLYYNTNIVKSQLRADLLRIKIEKMKRKE